MRFVYCFIAALVLATGVGGTAAASTADHDPRAAVLGRQKIREELAAALTKGYLTRMDQYHLLVHAKEVLSTEDLRGFERTLDRMAAEQAAKNGAAAPRGVASGRARGDDSPQVITTSRTEDVTPRVNATSGETSSDGPTIEEIPTGQGRPSMRLPMGGLLAEEAGCGCDGDDCGFKRQWLSVDLFTGVDAFKGPMDIGNANGNFGIRAGANAAVSIFPRLGIAMQAGMAADLTNLKGSPYPFPNATMRDQYFTTAGLFQRINRDDGSAITWGFAFDWLFDDYYSNFHFGQWRVKGEFEADPCNAFGAEASVSEHGSTGELPNFFGGVNFFSFKPITQGDLYWTHTFENFASVTGRFGVAERPGNFVFGGESCVPITRNFAITGNFRYIMPNVGAGPDGQAQEIWNVSVGIELVPGGFRRCGATGLRPFIPVADNGTFAVKEVQ
jgi:hypothetical protein